MQNKVRNNTIHNHHKMITIKINSSSYNKTIIKTNSIQ